MLDYNHRPSFADRVNAAVDEALTADQATRPPRDYLGGSRLGHACERALQFEFTATPKDEGADFTGQTLRIFAIGHALEDLAVAWLRGAGFDLYTRKGNRPDGGQFGFSVAGGRIRGHVDGIIAAGPEALRPGRSRALGMQDHEREELARLRQGRRDEVEAGLRRPDRGLPGLHGRRRCPASRPHPALFTAINKDTAELHHELVPFDADLAQRMSDRGVRILQATDAGELLPRIATTPDFFECRFCPWSERCWGLPA